jgi:hypothetical protein
MYTRENLLKNLSEVNHVIELTLSEAEIAEKHGDQDYACTMRCVLDTAIGRREEITRALKMV